MTQWHIFIAFFRVGMLGYGGGPSSIPLVKKEVVEKYKWLDDEEFSNILALCNSLPGPIATKMAGYIGYRVAGLWGMVNAVLATIIPTIVIMILLLTFLASMSDQPWVQGMTRAVVPVVGVMLAVLTYEFLKKAKGGLGWVVMSILVVVSVLLIEVAGVHPAFLIGALLVYALVKPHKEKEQKEDEKVRGKMSL
ncbi:chromate transporter [Aquibacillus salsiterrae]|uniref:Chromate transporter n=1 Tax=Aquibacillus salsiterrae TaxID=2950439 RepID=A0A9X4AG24_9BACI|nr:chromate transporter [Aquibacillus salsiterrae]MDC3416648.1 chromate transporter [Aquibacillus salsiterrae]